MSCKISQTLSLHNNAGQGGKRGVICNPPASEKMCCCFTKDELIKNQISYLRN